MDRIKTNIQFGLYKREKTGVSSPIVEYLQKQTEKQAKEVLAKEVFCQYLVDPLKDMRKLTKFSVGWWSAVPPLQQKQLQYFQYPSSGNLYIRLLPSSQQLARVSTSWAGVVAQW